MGRVKYIGHTGMTVSDIDSSIAFYRDVLRFPVSQKVRVQGQQFQALTGVPDAIIDVAFVYAGNHVIELLGYVSPLDKQASQLRPCDPGFSHLCLKVSDIDSVVTAAEASRFGRVGPTQTIPDGPAKGMRAVYIRDPDGTVLELIEEPAGMVLERLFE